MCMTLSFLFFTYMLAHKGSYILLYYNSVCIFYKFKTNFHCCRLRDERGDIERVIAMDKAREGSHNGENTYYLN